MVLNFEVTASSNGTVMLTALWDSSSSPEPESWPAWLEAVSFAGLSLGLDQPNKKPWCSNPGLGEWQLTINRLRCA